MSFNLANKPLAERAALEDEKSRLYDLWQSNLGKAKGDAARLFGERAKRKGKWAEWVRSELDATESYIGGHPWQTVAISAGFGLVVGLLLGRRN